MLLQPNISSENKNCPSHLLPAPIDKVNNDVFFVISSAIFSGTHSTSTPHAPVFSIS